MIRAAAAVFACLCLAHSSTGEPHSLRAYAHSSHYNKELITILSNIEERLRVVDTISVIQAKQARRLDVIQDKLDRLETTIQLKLERVQLAVDRLDHRLHMFQSNIQTSINENTEKTEKILSKIESVTRNITSCNASNKNVLEKENEAYSEISRRSLVLEGLMRDGVAVVNATRRELADGLRAIARRQGSVKIGWQVELDSILTKRLNENSDKINNKVQGVIDTQKRFVDSCQRVQQDDPTHVADVLDKLVDSLINKTTSTFRELQSIQSTIRNHDIKVMKLLNPIRVPQAQPTDPQNDFTCRRLETALRNASMTAFKEKELQQLTEKFVDLTNRADAALQKFETRMLDETDEPPLVSDVTAEADQLLLKLDGIRNENIISEENSDDDFFEDDIINEDLIDEHTKEEINRAELGSRGSMIKNLTPNIQHRRHPHKHPYDRGPS